MAKSHLALETKHPVLQVVVAVLGGLLTLFVLSFVTGGLFPFIEFGVAVAVVFFLARR